MPVRGYVLIEAEVGRAKAVGEAVKALRHKDAKVIAPYGGDTAFLFQINRRGWPVGGNIEGKIARGATDYVTVTFDEEANRLLGECGPVLKTEKYAILSIRHCNR